MRTRWWKRWTACTNEPARASARTRSDRTAPRCFAAIALTLAIAAPGAFPQHLDLDGPASPELGDTSALVQFRERLIRERETATAQAAETTDPAVRAGLRMRAALRALAMALVGTGCEDARYGAIGSLAGLRLVDAMDALDAIASESVEQALAGHRAMREGGGDAEVIARWERVRGATETTTRRCESLAQAIESGGTDPTTLDALDEALAHALAELRTVVPGGPDIEPAWPPALERRSLGTVDDAARALDTMAVDPMMTDALAAAFSSVRAGEAAPEVRRDRRRLAWRIVDAVRAVGIVNAAKITPTLALGVSSACEAIADPGRRAVGAARIEAIARVGELTEHAVALEVEGVDIAGLREAIGVLVVGLAAPIGDTTPPDKQTILVIGAIERLADDARRAPRSATLDFRDGKFNRAWRALVKRHEGIEHRAFDLGAHMARAPGVVGTPEEAATARALADSTAALVRIAALADWIAELRGGPTSGTVGPTRAGAADRLTVIRRGIGYDEHRDAALEELARWEQMRPLVLALPAESMLMANDPRIAPATRSRGPAVVRVMDVVRAAWLSAWSRADEAASIEATGRIALLRRLGDALVVAAALRDEGLTERVSKWAAFRITPSALDDVRARAEAVLGEAVSAAIDAQYDRLSGLLEEWDEACAGARLIARLSEVSALRSDWPSEDGATGVIAQLGAPPPADAWLLDRRGELAEISAWLAELDGATAREDRGMADAIVAWINHLAEPVVEEIHHRGTEVTELKKE